MCLFVYLVSEYLLYLPLLSLIARSQFCPGNGPRGTQSGVHRRSLYFKCEHGGIRIRLGVSSPLCRELCDRLIRPPGDGSKTSSTTGYESKERTYGPLKRGLRFDFMVSCSRQVGGKSWQKRRLCGVSHSHVVVLFLQVFAPVLDCLGCHLQIS